MTATGSETTSEPTPQRDDRALTPSPRNGGRRVTDLSAAVGGVLWLAVAAGARADTIAISEIELYVALAMLVLVPLGLGLLRPPAGEAQLYTIIVLAQCPAALAAIGALALPQGVTTTVVLAVPWLVVTGLIADLGLTRLVLRRGGPLPELAIDAGLMYVPVAAVFLLLHAAGVSLRFSPVIVLLTAVHFHYAGFALPLVVGLTGRLVTGTDGRFESTIGGRIAAATTVVIVAGILLIAIGITFSPIVEVAAAAVFTVAVVGFAAIVLRKVVPTVPRLPGALLTISALSLFWTMALALAFAYGQLPGTDPIVSIPAMVRWHGSVNAVGFALPAMLAFRLLDTGSA